jgi:hypothetical protein
VRRWDDAAEVVGLGEGAANSSSEGWNTGASGMQLEVVVVVVMAPAMEGQPLLMDG